MKTESERITIIDDQIKVDRNGNNYANVKLDDGRYLNFFGNDCKVYETHGLGEYTAIIMRNGKYWNIEAGSLKNITGASNGSKFKEERKETPKSFARDLDTNRSILVQTCIKAAADIYHGSSPVEAGQSLCVMMAEKFFKFAEKALNGDKKADIEPQEDDTNDAQE